MIKTAEISKTRRHLILCLAGAVASGAALPVRAFDGNELDPADIVPGRFSLERFIGLDRNEIHMVNLAVRRGRGIVIDGFSVSESRRIISRAAEDWPATRNMLRDRYGG